MKSAIFEFYWCISIIIIAYLLFVPHPHYLARYLVTINFSHYFFLDQKLFLKKKQELHPYFLF